MAPYSIFFCLEPVNNNQISEFSKTISTADSKKCLEFVWIPFLGCPEFARLAWKDSLTCFPWHSPVPLLCPSRHSGSLVLVLVLTVLQLSDGSGHADSGRAHGVRRAAELGAVCGVQVTAAGRRRRAAQST